MPTDRAQPDQHSPEATRRREADATLERLSRDNGSFGLPQFGFTPDEHTDDAAERWGRRAGRALWLVALVVVIYSLIRLLVFSPA
ncbi:MAG: hypothetical protein P4L82_11465 [Ancalomicrobiaceae bacterium]|nr:hypothetical protein [Ancalomicrobiaceae bacterium]